GPQPPAPVRCSAVYDNILLAHADRSRIVRPFDRRRLGYMEGASFGSVLIDGFVGATWTLKRSPRTATLRLGFIDKQPKRERAAVEDEAARLLTFFASDATSRNVMLSDADAQPRTSP